jgi:hypothetical protein
MGLFSSVSKSLFGSGSSKVKTPDDRDYYKEGRSTLDAQKKLAPDIFGTVGDYQDDYSNLYGTALQDVQTTQQQQNPELYSLYSMLANQAQTDLANNGALSDDEIRQIEQDSRSAWADRGLANSDASAYAEVMDLDSARRERRREAQDLAGYVSGLLSGDQQYTTSQSNSQLATLMNMFDPYNSYSQDLYNTNYNAQASAYNSTANNNAALTGSILDLTGNLGSAWLCWVAREVYGADNPRWRMFRNWLLTDAPRWFRALYIAYGPDFARWIADKPRLKRVIRRWMDRRIEGRCVEVPGIYRDIVREG